MRHVPACGTLPRPHAQTQVRGRGEEEGEGGVRKAELFYLHRSIVEDSTLMKCQLS